MRTCTNTSDIETILYYYFNNKCMYEYNYVAKIISCS